MSAFQPYAGVYEFRGERFAWRCYATVRVHGVRQADHGPAPGAPTGRKWLRQPQRLHTPDVAWLVDEAVEEFSHILLQVLPDAVPRAAPQTAVGEHATA